MAIPPPDFISPSPADAIPPLEAGDLLTRSEFERRYRAMPALKKAELIEGVVYTPSPVSADHGLWLDLGALLRGDGLGVFAALQRGLDSAGHAGFVAALQERRR